MSIKIYSPEETKQFIKKIPYGYEFNYKNCIAKGVDLYNDTHKLISKNFVINILQEINKKFPLYWANLDIFCLPFVYMQWTEKSGFTGREYLGRAWNDVYVLGAVRKDKPDYFIASTIAHELFHIYSYKFIDPDNYDGEDTPEYKKFKELMGIKGRMDENCFIWENKPSEILAELGRLSLGGIFIKDPSRIFKNNNIRKYKKAVDYLYSFLPERKEGDKNMGIIKKDYIYGVPFKVDLIPESNGTSRPGYPMIPEYITIHNTGNKKADAEANSEWLDKTTKYVSWHFTVDDKQIIQELPINENAWHAGDGKDGTGNRKSIGIEICEYEGIDWEKAKNNACKLIKFLIKNVKTLKGIDCIVPHQHWSGKYCPHKILDEGWDKFIERVKKYMNSKYIGYEIVEEVPIVLDGKELDIKAPMIETSEGGHTFLPIRAFLETLRDEWGLDISVGWDGRVLLNKKKE